MTQADFLDSSKIERLVEKRFSKNSEPISGKLIQIIGLAHAPEIEISKNYWMCFPGFANNG